MHTIIKRMAALVLCLWLLTISAAAKELIPVGQVVGLELQNGKVTVEGFDDTFGDNAQQAGLSKGDVIRKINNTTVRCAEDVRQALRQSAGTVTVVVERDGKTQTCRVEPRITQEGPKLGVYLRQGITGIGTVTWYDPETKKFATLGHGVSGADGKLLSMTEGNAFKARVAAVKKGKSGAPGQLVGAVTDTEPVGQLSSNTAQGLFGTTGTPWQGDTMEVADISEIKTGKATVLFTVSGNEVREYSVEILKIYPKSKQSGRNLLIRVTDPVLLETTGGIVQGMSGSPIIQDGKLVGAVTHVLVNDPTTGYGIFIENMLDAAA